MNDITIINYSLFQKDADKVTIYELPKHIEIFMTDIDGRTDGFEIHARLYSTCACHAISWQTGTGTWKELKARYVALADQYNLQ